jgi:hypothetical protein
MSADHSRGNDNAQPTKVVFEVALHNRIPVVRVVKERRKDVCETSTQGF